MSWSWHSAAVVVPAVWDEWSHGVPSWMAPRMPPWLSVQYPVYLYQRHHPNSSCYCENMAHETGVYLTFLVQHWEALPAFIAFVQADWWLSNHHDYLTPVDFWQLNCARTADISWMPLGKRAFHWPPDTISRDSTFWEKEPSARWLAHGARRISSLVER